MAAYNFHKWTFNKNTLPNHNDLYAIVKYKYLMWFLRHRLVLAVLGIYIFNKIYWTIYPLNFLNIDLFEGQSICIYLSFLKQFPMLTFRRVVIIYTSISSTCECGCSCLLSHHCWTFSLMEAHLLIFYFVACALGVIFALRGASFDWQVGYV